MQNDILADTFLLFHWKWGTLMAINPDDYRNFRQVLDDIIEWAPIADENRDVIENEVFDEIIEKMDSIIKDSRPPRLYVFGRSGAGKSSLINALANKEEADVGSIKPTTMESQLYQIEFPEYHSEWEVVDSRGLFESVSPDGDVPADTISFLRDDLNQYRPDILIHVMTPGQVRAGEDDFKVVNELRDDLDGLFPPIVYCLNQIDHHLSPGGEWPPEQNPSLAGEITRNLDFLSEILEEEKTASFDPNRPYKGYYFNSEEHIGIVPLFLKDSDDWWNVETLSMLIGDFLPDSAQLQFYQAQRREGVMRRFSRRFTKVFAGTAATIGGAPLPIGDIAVLVPLQLSLVAMIGGLSDREFGLSAVKEYVGALGGTTVTGLAAREVARSLIQFVPVGGWAVSGAVAGGTTWAIGRSAEEYFFCDNIVKPALSS